jgi:hypothetical protein
LFDLQLFRRTHCALDTAQRLFGYLQVHTTKVMRLQSKRRWAALLRLLLVAVAYAVSAKGDPALGALPDSLAAAFRVVTTAFGGVPPTSPSQQQQQHATKEQLAALNSRSADALLLEGLNRRAPPGQVGAQCSVMYGCSFLACSTITASLFRVNVPVNSA